MSEKTPILQKIANNREIGKKCQLCNRVVQDTEYGNNNSSYGALRRGWCSEFCNVSNDNEKLEYLSADEGDFCLWPCPECGCPVEDEYNPDHSCSDCWQVVKLKRLLRECHAYLPTELQAKVSKAVQDDDA